MRWNDLSLATKLSIGFGLALALLAAVSLRAILGMSHAMDDIAEIQEGVGQTMMLNDKQIAHLNWALEASHALALDQPEKLDVELDHTQCSFGRWYYGGGREEMEGHYPETASILAALDPLHRDLHQSVRKIRDLYAAQGRAAMPVVNTIFRDETLVTLNRFQDMLGDLEVKFHAQVNRIEEQAVAHARDNHIFIISITIAAILIGVFMAWAITRSITRPIHAVVAAADRMATGDLDVEVATGDRQDEMGRLARSFSRMTEALRAEAALMTRIGEGDLTVSPTPLSPRDQMGNAMAVMVRNLKELLHINAQTVQVLAGSVSQISASTTEMSSSSAETASSISETTSTVEEVRQTTLVANDKAKSVAETAKASSKAAMEGKRLTEDIDEGMREIRKKMDYIAENIIRLSEKGQAIGEIIAAVNDLADQSNILAVNASIEAAKAGEEGKGFGVVAQEIRNLAERSKQSTAEIREILGDIQKATASAVMATEEGSKAVTEGESKASRAGEVIMDVVNAAAKDAQAATQISVTSQEQLAGMDQVALAMDNIRQAGEQNLESARQLESAFQDLNNQAKELQALMDRFKF